jgi:hypothetical protein
LILEEFSMADLNGREIKPGDLVRYKGSFYNGLELGRVERPVEYEEDAWMVYWFRDECSLWIVGKQMEIVTEDEAAVLLLDRSDCD